MSRVQAFRDAVRDILREEGVVKLASLEDPQVVWEYDGERWARTQLAGVPVAPGRRQR